MERGQNMNKKGHYKMINSQVRPYVNAAGLFTAIPTMIAGSVFAFKGDSILSVSEVYKIIERFMPISLFGMIMFVSAAFLFVGVCFRYIYRYYLIIPSSFIMTLCWLVYYSSAVEGNPNGWTMYLFLYFAAASFAVACMGVVAVWQILKIVRGSQT